MNQIARLSDVQHGWAVRYDQALGELDAHKDEWARLPVAERMQLLLGMKDGIMTVAEGWAEISARHKGLRPGTAIAGEEWIVGVPEHRLSVLPAMASSDRQL